VKWKGVAEDLKQAYSSFFIRFAMHRFTLFVSIYSFSQANFTFGFVENLNIYSETWLRISEVFKTSGNVLMVSRLQVGELPTFQLFAT